MRTARTIGINEDGSEVLLADSRIPINEQRQRYAAYFAKGLPAGVVRVDLMTSDGRLKTLSAATLVNRRQIEDSIDSKKQERHAKTEESDGVKRFFRGKPRTS